MASNKPMEPVALITGATGGLGRYIVRVFLDHGWTVVATDIRDPDQSDLCASPVCFYYHMDVTSDTSVAGVFREIREHHTHLDLIVHAAAVDRYFSLALTPVNSFREMFEINVFGAYRVNQVFLPMLRSPGSRIIFTGSESYHMTTPFMPYPLTKRLLESYARSLRIELKFYGIHVSVIRPGAIRTPLLDNVRNLTSAQGDTKLDKAFGTFARMAHKEIGRIAEPADVAWRVYQIACQRRPKALYRVNNMLKLRIAAWLPFRLFEAMIIKRLSKG